MTDEISDDVKRMAATIWMNRALAAEAKVDELTVALRDVLSIPSLSTRLDECVPVVRATAILNAVVAPEKPS